jgi:hypothetical protein
MLASLPVVLRPDAARLRDAGNERSIRIDTQGVGRVLAFQKDWAGAEGGSGRVVVGGGFIDQRVSGLPLFDLGFAVEGAALKVGLIHLVGHGQFHEARAFGHNGQGRAFAGHARLAEAGALCAQEFLVFGPHAAGAFAGLLLHAQTLVLHHLGVLHARGVLLLGSNLLHLRLHLHLLQLHLVVVVGQTLRGRGLLLLSVVRHPCAGKASSDGHTGQDSCGCASHISSKF